MRLSSLLSLPVALITAVLAAAPQHTNDYAEQLHLKPLHGGALYAGFNFTALTATLSYESQHFRYFPRSLGQILQFTHTAELHLRFALGRWDAAKWGSRPRAGSREGGTGVELWAWVEGDTPAQAQQRWHDLVNSLSGLFCASLNFIDQTKTSQPLLSFQPEGDLEHRNAPTYLMHGMLPREVVCTENLTPFLKLLPCKGKAGISSLLDGHKVFDSDWQTMAIDVRSVPGLDRDHYLEISQTVDMVLDLERSMRPRDNPIPRPPPIEQVRCDESKGYHAHDTCLPKRGDGDMEWSLVGIFGRPMIGSCPAGDRSTAVDIVLEIPADRDVETEAEQVSGAPEIRQYRLGEGRETDVRLSHHVGDSPIESDGSLVRASRQMTGYGQERGGIHAVITNPHAQAQRVVYMEMLPWFLRPYMHTLVVTGAKVDKMYYTPARDREKGTQLELLLDIPAESTVDLKYDFEKATLRYTEYPPDANRGFDIAPAIVRVLPSPGSNETQGHYLRTTSLLLPLPTPDFSMPYNVIILTSTVIALGFGSIFNMLTRRFVLLAEVPTPPFAVLVNKMRSQIKAAVAGWKAEPKPLESDGRDHSPATRANEGSESVDATTTGVAKVLNGNVLRTSGQPST